MNVLQNDISTSRENMCKKNYRLVTVILTLSSVALIYGNIYSLIAHTYAIGTVESICIVLNIILFFTLQIKKQYFDMVITIIATQYLLFFSFIMIFTRADDLKYIWIFTYPLLILYLKKENGLLWVYALIVAIALIKPLYHTYYTWYQISYIELCLIIITIVVKMYQNKIISDELLITKQYEQLKQYSNKLAEKQKLLLIQSRQAAMGEMIQMIAHQWRQPLSTITLQISNLQIQAVLSKITQEDILKALDNISNTIVYLSDTVDDFQTYFRQDREKQKIGVCDTIDKTIEFIKPRLVANKIKINIKCQNKIYIYSAINELIQVLINILNNATDILIQNRVADAVINLNAYKNDNDKVIIEIEDNGGGIDKQIIDKIFDPYFSTKGKNGNGIGLYMCKTIMQNQLNGMIKVTNTKQGARFTLQLPI